MLSSQVGYVIFNITHALSEDLKDTNISYKYKFFGILSLTKFNELLVTNIHGKKNIFKR